MRHDRKVEVIANFDVHSDEADVFLQSRGSGQVGATTERNALVSGLYDPQLPAPGLVSLTCLSFFPSSRILPGYHDTHYQSNCSIRRCCPIPDQYSIQVQLAYTKADGRHLQDVLEAVQEKGHGGYGGMGRYSVLVREKLAQKEIRWAPDSQCHYFCRQSCSFKQRQT